MMASAVTPYWEPSAAFPCRQSWTPPAFATLAPPYSSIFARTNRARRTLVVRDSAMEHRRRCGATHYLVVLVRTRPALTLIIRTWSRHRRCWSHSWSHPGTFSHIRGGLSGLPSGEAGHHRTRPIRRPQNSKAREGQPSAGSNPAATASPTRPKRRPRRNFGAGVLGCGLNWVPIGASPLDRSAITPYGLVRPNHGGDALSRSE